MNNDLEVFVLGNVATQILSCAWQMYSRFHTAPVLCNDVCWRTEHHDFLARVTFEYMCCCNISGWSLHPADLMSHFPTLHSQRLPSSHPSPGAVSSHSLKSVSISTSDYTLQGLSSPTTFSLGICSLLAWHENAAGCSVVFRVYSVAFPLNDLSQSCNKTIRRWSWRQEINEASQCICLDGDLACASRVVLSISVYGVGVLTVSI